MLSRRIVFLNIFLLLVAGLLAYQLISTWNSFKPESELQQVLEQASGASASLEIPDRLSSEQPLVHDFFVIAERTLFDPERRLEEPEPEEQVVQQAPVFPKRPEMQGVAGFGDETKALVRVFENARDQGELRSVGVGDQIQGWAVADMSNTTVTLRWNEQEEILDMFASEGAPEQPRPAGNQMAAVKVIRIGSSHAAVETNTSSEAQSEEEGGLEVGIVRSQAGAARGVASPRGGRGAAGGATSRSSVGRSSRGAQSGVVGGFGGGRTSSTVAGASTRRPN